MRCSACRRPLTNPVSLKHGLGPDCLKRAVMAGNAPLEALEELTAYQKSKPRKRLAKVKAPDFESPTFDLFEALREAALDDLNKAVTACESVGLKVSFVVA